MKRVELIQRLTQKQQEEQRREQCWDPPQRWRVLQETITWAERQATVRRNDPARRAQEQARQQRPAPTATDKC